MVSNMLEHAINTRAPTIMRVFSKQLPYELSQSSSSFYLQPDDFAFRAKFAGKKAEIVDRYLAHRNGYANQLRESLTKKRKLVLSHIQIVIRRPR
jgi:hypothetical protein